MTELPARVLIADNEAGSRAALADLLSGQAGFEVVGVAMDCDEACELLWQLKPEVAVIDARMPCGGAPRVARHLSSLSPATAIVVLAVHENPGLRRLLSQAGAVDYLIKGAASPAQMLAAVERAAAESRRRRHQGAGTGERQAPVPEAGG